MQALAKTTFHGVSPWENPFHDLESIHLKQTGKNPHNVQQKSCSPRCHSSRSRTKAKVNRISLKINKVNLQSQKSVSPIKSNKRAFEQCIQSLTHKVMKQSQGRRYLSPQVSRETKVMSIQAWKEKSKRFLMNLKQKKFTSKIERSKSSIQKYRAVDKDEKVQLFESPRPQTSPIRQSELVYKKVKYENPNMNRFKLIQQRMRF